MLKRSPFRLLVICSSLLVVVCSGCTNYRIYDDTNSWAAMDSDIPAFFATYDLFYLYPSQVKSTHSAYMDWMHDNLAENIRRRVTSQTSALFGGQVRVFSPLLPQLSYDKYRELMEKRLESPKDFDFSKTGLSLTIDYATCAFKYYLKYCNQDKPYVLIGQGQGAAILYEVMKNCSDIRPDKGFVAAYFFGLPGISAEDIKRDFGSRGIHPAAKRSDVGVVVCCNVLLPGDKEYEKFLAPGGLVMNPLTWRTDAEPASGKLNRGGLFYDHREKNPARRVRRMPEYCGGKIDPAKSAVVLTGIIPAGKKHQLREHAFDTDAWGVFAVNVGQNVKERVSTYLFIRENGPIVSE